MILPKCLTWVVRKSTWNMLEKNDYATTNESLFWVYKMINCWIDIHLNSYQKKLTYFLKMCQKNCSLLNERLLEHYRVQMTSPWIHNDLPEYENVYGEYNEALFKFGDIIEINQASKNNFVSPNSFNNSSMVLDWINLEANIYQTFFLISLFLKKWVFIWLYISRRCMKN